MNDREVKIVFPRRERSDGEILGAIRGGLSKWLGDATLSSLPAPSLDYGEPLQMLWRDGEREKAGWCLGVGAYTAWVEGRS